MAKTRTYIVSFTPAEKTDFGYSVILSQLSTGKRHEVTTNNYYDLEREVRRLAGEFGKTCAPYIRLPVGERSPPAFDRFCNTLRFIEAMPALIG